MTEKIVASNGWELREDGAIYSNPTTRHKLVSKEGTEALREVFQLERDEELGRWRERPECGLVVYPNGSDEFGNRCVRVLWESTGTNILIWENKIPGTIFGDAARNYFAAHPEPKPWHDAKPGEVWALTVDGREFAGDVDSDMEVRCHERQDYIHIESTAITAGRRIWPEGDNK